MEHETKAAVSLDRRDAIKVMALLPFAVVWDITPPQLERATDLLLDEQMRMAAPPYVPKFFKPSEWQTVRMLADYIIPSDERSGSATDAKVPEYMDFLLADKDASENFKVAMQGGLGWIDFECTERFGKPFVRCTDAQRRQVLDDIAWPAKAKTEHSHGVAFFSQFRDLTASGFFSSAMGWKDVEYRGNVFNPNWNGCPPEANARLGVTPAVMSTRVKPQTR